jgi:hypothetical protein
MESPRMFRNGNSARTIYFALAAKPFLRKAGLWNGLVDWKSLRNIMKILGSFLLKTSGKVSLKLPESLKLSGS